MNSDLCKSRGFQCYHETLALHTFALCPGGWEPWSPRLYDAMYDGAIPVILADNMKLPFRDYLDWKGFVFDWPMESASKKNTTMLGLWWMKRHARTAAARHAREDATGVAIFGLASIVAKSTENEKISNVYAAT